MNKKIKLAVILTCYNRRLKTQKCLASLFKNTFTKIKYDVFLVDDNSTDGTSEMIKNNFPLVNVIKGTGNLFWNRGMHLAWESASINDYDSYLWLNDDTYLKNNALESIYYAHMEKPNSILVGTLLNDSINNKSKNISYGGRLLKSRYNIVIPNKNFTRCDIFNGNCVLVPRSVFLKLGNLDYYFRHSYGDFEYGLRALKNNIKSYVIKGYLGYCKKDYGEGDYTFLSKKYSIIKRFKLLYSPLGKNPFEAFHISIKYNSLIYSILVFIKLHLNVIFRLK